MSFFLKLKEDPLLGRVLRSSGALFGSNSISLVLSVLQSILAARLLDPAGFGLVAIITGYATTVNGFLSFRMSETVVRFGGQYLEQNEKKKLVALLKFASLMEASVSLLAFLVVLGSAHLASLHIAKNPAMAPFFIVYGLGLLANFNTETSTGLLQLLGQIKYQGLINLAQSLLTAVLIAYAYFTGGTVQQVLFAYLAGKVLLGMAIFFTAFHHLTRQLGRDWWKPWHGLHAAGVNFREVFNFAFSSNLSATAILVFRESEILWIGYFLTSEAAGYYKAAYAIVGLLSVPANPFILTTYPEINKLAVQKAWRRLVDFLKKITSIAAGYNLALALFFLIFGRWLLGIYGARYTVAYPALVALLVGFTFNYILFWNRPLLLALGLPQVPLKTAIFAGVSKLALAFLMVPRFGYIAEAFLLSLYYITSVGANVLRGVREIKNHEDCTDH